MKKSLLAVALTAALPVIAQAQTNVVLFGRADVAVEYGKSGSASGFRMSDGVNSPSRWGIRGTEDLGGGLKAIFWFEQGFNLNAGTLYNRGGKNPGDSTDDGGSMFTRRSFVGLEGGFGTIKLGREYTPGFWPWLFADEMGLGYYGSLLFHGMTGGSGQVGASLGQNVRFSNGIHYESPSFGGVKVRAAYAFSNNIAPNDGLGNNGANKSNGQKLGASIDYTGGPFYIGYGHHSNTYDVATGGTGTEKFDVLGLKYTFGAFNVTAGYMVLNPALDNNSTKSYWVGFGGDMGAHSWGIQVAQGKSDLTDAAGTKEKATTIGLRYAYNLSKRTQLYATAGKVNNNSAGSFWLAGSTSSTSLFGPGLSGSVRGDDPQAIALGVAHNF